MADKTNFEKVIEFNKMFGIPTNDTPQKDMFTEDPKLVEYRMSLIREEVQELEDAVKDNDITETLDALGDILYVVYGMGVTLGLDLDKGMGLVHNSNMSKLCKTEEEAQETVTWYKEQYELKKLKYDTPAYRKSYDDKYWVVYNESTKKILKSINYKPVDFTIMFHK